jgi:hypothetical protein
METAVIMVDQADKAVKENSEIETLIPAMATITIKAILEANRGKKDIVNIARKLGILLINVSNAHATSTTNNKQQTLVV